MKFGMIIALAVVCALFSIVNCNVATTVAQDGGGGGEGKDQGTGPAEDGGEAADSGASDGGGAECPAIAPLYPCDVDADCQAGYTCEPMFADKPECGYACKWIDILTDGGPGDGGGCPAGSSGIATCVTDTDCPQDGVCVRYLAGHDECGTYCRIPDVDGGPFDGGGGCANPCECGWGEVCEGGKCVQPGGTTGTVFCCDRPCPTGAPCQHATGAFDKCAGDADVGQPDAGGCVGEGESINKTGDPSPPQCCAGLEAIPLMAVDSSTGGCMMPGCDCVVCVQPCGDGTCSKGKNGCNCAKDCPKGVFGGPGSPCTDSKECTSGTCMAEQYGYPTGGYCMGDTCDPAVVPGPCPAGTICTPLMFSQALGHCMPSCRKDADCRAGLTCEWLQSYRGPGEGTYICWQGGLSMLGGAKALGKACTKDQDCLSGTCTGDPDTGAKKCSVFCDRSSPCKEGMICKPMGGCSSPQCGACF